MSVMDSESSQALRVCGGNECSSALLHSYYSECSFRDVLPITGVCSFMPHVSFTKGIRDLHTCYFPEGRKSYSQHSV